MLGTQTVAAVKPDPKKPPCVIFSTGKSGFMAVSITTYCRQELNAAENAVLQLPNVGKFCSVCETNYKAAVEQLSK